MRSKVPFWVLVIGLVIGCNGWAGSLGATVYRYQDLNLQGFPSGGGANAINEAKQIVGTISQTSGSTTTTRAFLWDPVKGLTLLQSLGGTNTLAYGINKQGQTVGSAETGSATHPCLWTDPSKAPIDLGVLPGDSAAWAKAINDNGLIIGQSPLVGYKWTTPGHPVAVGPVGDFAEGVNNAGQIVGNKGSQGCIWGPGETVQIIADSTNALFINNQGNVVGVAPNGIGGYTNFYWDHKTGKMLYLGVATHAISFNDNNQAIAFDSFLANKVYLWSPTQIILEKDITKLVVNLPRGVTITKISLLGPKGYILGADSQGHVCLLTPLAAFPANNLLLLD